MEEEERKIDGREDSEERELTVPFVANPLLSPAPIAGTSSSPLPGDLQMSRPGLFGEYSLCTCFLTVLTTLSLQRPSDAPAEVNLPL